MVQHDSSTHMDGTYERMVKYDPSTHRDGTVLIMT